MRGMNGQRNQAHDGLAHDEKPVSGAMPCVVLQELNAPLAFVIHMAIVQFERYWIHASMCDPCKHVRGHRNHY